MRSDKTQDGQVKVVKSLLHDVEEPEPDGGQ